MIVKCWQIDFWKNYGVEISTRNFCGILKKSSILKMVEIRQLASFFQIFFRECIFRSSFYINRRSKSINLSSHKSLNLYLELFSDNFIIFDQSLSWKIQKNSESKIEKNVPECILRGQYEFQKVTEYHFPSFLILHFIIWRDQRKKIFFL